MGNLHDWHLVEERLVFPGFRGKFVHSENMTFVLWDIDEGATLPVHHHASEQVASIIEGEFEITVDGFMSRLKAGCVIVIPSNAVHSGRAITACRILDTFSPRREDYMTGSGPV